MISLKRIVYYTNEATPDKDKYISIKDLCLYFFDEGLDDDIVYRRIASHISAYRNMFSIKKDGRRKLLRLNANGYRYLNKFIGTFNHLENKVI